MSEIIEHDDFGTPLVAQFQASNYMTSTRQMNVDDFTDPEEGGYRLANNINSSTRELNQFMESRGLRPSEPLEVRISVEVTARTEPVPTEATVDPFEDPLPFDLPGPVIN